MNLYLYPAKKHLHTMLIHLLRFNVDCDAAAGLYGAAEGAFGSSGGGVNPQKSVKSQKV